MWVRQVACLKSLEHLVALPKHIRLGWISLAGTNAPDYLTHWQISAVKSLYHLTEVLFKNFVSMNKFLTFKILISRVEFQFGDRDTRQSKPIAELIWWDYTLKVQAWVQCCWHIYGILKRFIRNLLILIKMIHYKILRNARVVLKEHNCSLETGMWDDQNQS